MEPVWHRIGHPLPYGVTPPRRWRSVEMPRDQLAKENLARRKRLEGATSCERDPYPSSTPLKKFLILRFLSATERFMDAAEIVECDPKRDSRTVIFRPLRKPIRELKCASTI